MAKKGNSNLSKHLSKKSDLIGMQSIAEMFQKQRSRVGSNKANSKDFNSDDKDVIIVEADTISPYFGQGKYNILSTKMVKSTEESSNNKRSKKLSLSKNNRKSDSVCNKSTSTGNKNNMVCPIARDKNEASGCDTLILADDTLEINVKLDQRFSSEKALKRENTEKISDTKGTPQTKRPCFETHNRNLFSDSSTATPSSSSAITSEECENSSPTGFLQKFNRDSSLAVSKSGNQQIDDEDISCSFNSSLGTDSEEVKNAGTEELQYNAFDEQQQNSIGANASGSEPPEYRTPYYLNNFETILKNVLDDEANRDLFNEDDMQYISAYQKFSDSAKKLYIRMFSRKLRWISLSKLNYPEIAEDLTPHLQELVQAEFLYSEENLTDLEEALNALSANDIKMMAKSYHLDSSVTQKGQIVQELLKRSQQSNITNMFGCHRGSVPKTMLVRARKYLNSLYKLRCEPKRVFVRVMMLFSLINTALDEESGSGGQSQLFQMLMVNMGKIVYPTFTVEKAHKIFQDREDVIRFEQALQLETDLLQCTERGNWEKAYKVFQVIEDDWKQLEANKEIVQEFSHTTFLYPLSLLRWNESLPGFLRSFTATSVIYRLLSAGIEIIQRRKNFEEAVALLEKLLAQTTYSCSHRGYWWERLALNLDAHLKRPLQSLEAVAKGLTDTNVIGGHRYALYLRAENICQRPKLKLAHRLKDFYFETVLQTPKIFIEGRVIHQSLLTNGTRFLTDGSSNDGNSQDMTVCGVEEYVLDYYKNHGYPSGIHAEGSVVSSLFALFFWDILFLSLPDAFHSPFQSQPLDLHSHLFYSRREDVIEERLSKLEKSSAQELQAMAEETWITHEGVSCAGMGWDRMRSLGHVKDLVGCMGGKVLSGIVGRYARCPRHTRGGFPDLTLWNAETGALKICEVKGPGDRLSHKQILWIDYLVKLGVDAEVCHVKAVAAKKLKPPS